MNPIIPLTLAAVLFLLISTAQLLELILPAIRTIL